MYVSRVRIYAWISLCHIWNVSTWDTLILAISRNLPVIRGVLTQSVLLNSFISFRLKNRFRRTIPRTDQKAFQWLVSRECPWWWWWWTGACSASSSAWWSCASLGPLGRPSGWHFWCFDCCFLYLLWVVCCTTLACLIFVVCSCSVY